MPKRGLPDAVFGRFLSNYGRSVMESGQFDTRLARLMPSLGRAKVKFPLPSW